MESTSRPVRRIYSASGPQVSKLPVQSRSYPLARQLQLHDDGRQSDFSEAMWPKQGAWVVPGGAGPTPAIASLRAQVCLSALFLS